MDFVFSFFVSVLFWVSCSFLFCLIFVWANASNMNRIAYVGINKDKGSLQQK